MRWDIFCRVIDNHGELGVCWRLSSHLAARGQRVRLWVDDASALVWMAPEAKLDAEGWAHLIFDKGEVEVRPWDADLSPSAEAAHVWIEAFGCELPDHFLQSHQAKLPHEKAPVWINLEYLSAESYVERSHRLPSPVMSGPMKGRTKWFFYPGFTAMTGGLLREKYLEESITWQTTEETSVAPDVRFALPTQSSLFCYEPAALSEALLLSSFNRPEHEWQVAHGRGALAFDKAVSALSDTESPPNYQKITPLSQIDYDKLLRACDLNFVRGEDSLIRALWAGKALVWHIYPQEDGAHAAKLNAFLDWLNAPDSLRQFHLTWNGLSQRRLPEIDLLAWQACVQSARQRLMKQADLVSQLLQFVAEKG